MLYNYEFKVDTHLITSLCTDFENIMQGKKETCVVFDRCLLHVVNKVIPRIHDNSDNLDSHFYFYSCDFCKGSDMFKTSSCNPQDKNPVDTGEMIRANSINKMVIIYLNSRVKDSSNRISSDVPLTIKSLKQAINDIDFDVSSSDSPEYLKESVSLRDLEKKALYPDNEGTRNPKIDQLWEKTGLALLCVITFVAAVPTLPVLILVIFCIIHDSYYPKQD